MRSNPFSFRSLSIFVAGVALVAAACSDDTAPETASVTQVEVRVGTRAPIRMGTAGGSVLNIPVGNHADTIVQLTFLRADGQADPVVIPGRGWRSTAVSSSNALIVTGPRLQDAFGWVIKASTAVTNANVDFTLLDPNGSIVFGPVPVKFSAP
jgi:hypothetical protein